jgi:peroxiredoxin (alkyl hydroperoxide reductase subunit C)
VCSSELLELACTQDEFKALNVDVLVLSTDSMEKHHLWIKSLEELCYKKQNTRDIDIPLLTDYNYRITRKFGMLHHPYSSNRDIRGVFLIDPENTVRFVQFYPVEIGQNIEELKRVAIALQKADEEKIFTPANWQPGEDVLLRCPRVCSEPDPNINQLSWYMTFQKQRDLNAPDLASKEKTEKQGEGVNPIIE